MNIGLNRIKSKPELRIIKVLYNSAFPEKERREFSELENLLLVNNCLIYSIDAENIGFSGFCICWDLGGFAFIEHFAVNPELRGLGIGEKTLSLLKTRHNKTILLETEPEVDEITARRVHFYQRNGFRMLHRFYIQPSYGINKPEVELKLMYCGEEPDSNQLDDMINRIKKNVYQVN
jgi:ribosomal protein S18 acetylase RimI-like enzyme